MAKESYMQTKILKWLRSQGYYAVKIISTTKNGSPDIIACINGKFVGIEVKIDYNELTELQKYNQRQIIAAGGKFILAYNLDNVKQQIKE